MAITALSGFHIRTGDNRVIWPTKTMLRPPIVGVYEFTSPGDATAASCLCCSSYVGEFWMEGLKIITDTGFLDRSYIQDRWVPKSGQSQEQADNTKYLLFNETGFRKINKTSTFYIWLKAGTYRFAGIHINTIDVKKTGGYFAIREGGEGLAGLLGDRPAISYYLATSTKGMQYISNVNLTLPPNYATTPDWTSTYIRPDGTIGANV